MDLIVTQDEGKGGRIGSAHIPPKIRKGQGHRPPRWKKEEIIKKKL
jgi:hypothetical protein